MTYQQPNYGSTKPYKENFNFQWTINSFSTLMSHKNLVSPTFRGGPVGQHVWKIVVKPRTKVNGVDYLSLDLEMYLLGCEEMAGEHRDLTIDTSFRIIVVDSKGKLIKTGALLLHKFNDKNCNSRGISTFHETSELFHPETGLVGGDDTLNLQCHISTSGITQSVRGFKKIDFVGSTTVETQKQRQKEQQQQVPVSPKQKTIDTVKSDKIEKKTKEGKKKKVQNSVKTTKQTKTVDMHSNNSDDMSKESLREEVIPSQQFEGDGDPVTDKSPCRFV